ncbi:MAG: DNA mismatch repair protein MutS [Calditrichaeota bacterium]|nr:MAG: DNA mismatch repair protein MutS [Calditrichota bacterium]
MSVHDNRDDQEPLEFPIDGVLDLHMFHPRDVKVLVPEYIQACRERGIVQIRIIHGKGTGTLRRVVHAILKKHPAVAAFWQEGSAGGWGATVVALQGEDPGKKDQP